MATDGMVNAEDVVIQAQKIAVLMQLATFLKATEVGVAKEVGAQVQMQILDRQRTTLFVNSNILKEVLTAEYNKLGQELTHAGIDLDKMLEGEKQRFNAMYGISND